MAKPRSGLSEIIRKADSCLYKSKSALSVDTCTSGSVGAMVRSTSLLSLGVSFPPSHTCSVPFRFI